MPAAKHELAKIEQQCPFDGASVTVSAKMDLWFLLG
jgi:hypothetical protein